MVKKKAKKKSKNDKDLYKKIVRDLNAWHPGEIRSVKKSANGVWRVETNVLGVQFKRGGKSYPFARFRITLHGKELNVRMYGRRVLTREAAEDYFYNKDAEGKFTDDDFERLKKRNLPSEYYVGGAYYRTPTGGGKNYLDFSVYDMCYGNYAIWNDLDKGDVLAALHATMVILNQPAFEVGKNGYKDYWVEAMPELKYCGHCDNPKKECVCGKCVKCKKRFTESEKSGCLQCERCGLCGCKRGCVKLVKRKMNKGVPQEALEVLEAM